MIELWQLVLFAILLWFIYGMTQPTATPSVPQRQFKDFLEIESVHTLNINKQRRIRLGLEPVIT